MTRGNTTMTRRGNGEEVEVGGYEDEE